MMIGASHHFLLALRKPAVSDGLLPCSMVSFFVAILDCMEMGAVL